MVVVPPDHYCIILNPIQRGKDGEPVEDRYGQVKHRLGTREVRLTQDPFSLWPLEEMHEAVQPLKVLGEDEALVLRAEKDVDAADFPSLNKREGESESECEKPKEKKPSLPVSRKAGEEWLFVGPATYIPHADVSVLRVVKALIVLPHTAVHLRAKRNLTDRFGVGRTAGEEWSMTSTGPYLPGVYEEVLRVVDGVVLSPSLSLHLRAKITFTDNYGKERKAGEEWLVTVQDTPVHIPHVYEEIVRTVPAVVLGLNEYCVVVNPVREGKADLGAREMRVGPLVFFPQPIEKVEKVAKVCVLNEDEAFYVRAIERYREVNGTQRQPGDRWLVYGPLKYIPPLEVEGMS